MTSFAQLEKIGEHAKGRSSLPDCVLMFFDRLLAFDHLRHQIHIVAAGRRRATVSDAAYDRAPADIAALGSVNWPPDCGPAPGSKAAKSKSGNAEGSRRNQSQRCLSQGRRAAPRSTSPPAISFRSCFSQRLDFAPEVAPFDLYRALRAGESLALSVLPAHGRYARAGLVAGNAGASYRTQAGIPSHRRHASARRDEAEDARLEQQMLHDEKERAEHVMLVDLGRNDLGRVSEYGSVKVKDLMYVERYSHVMHLVSALEGKLRAISTRSTPSPPAFPPAR